MENKDIAKILEEIAVLLEIRGENVFKIAAYQNAARRIYSLQRQVSQLVKEHTLQNQKGIGKALTSLIEELVLTGQSKLYDTLKESVPAGLLEMLKIPGLGPKKIKVLYETLGIQTIGELEYACLENRLIKLKGFGSKTQEKIVDGIRYIKRFQGHFLGAEAWEQAKNLLGWFKMEAPSAEIKVVGGLRRYKEIVKAIDLLIGADNDRDITEIFVSYPEVDRITERGQTKTRVLFKQGLACDLRVVTKEQFVFALQHFTGSKEHNIVMRRLAKTQGIELNEYGAFEDGNLIPCTSEADIYHILDLEYIPPELREGKGEIEAASKNRLPQLVELKDIRGIMHVHSIYSDGKNSLKEMVTYVRELGYQYIGISEHSQTAGYAGGLKIDDLKRQKEEVEYLREQFPDFGIFWGIESDILADGSLDYPDEILAQFDFVIGSIHSGFSNDLEKMMKRLVTALKNPFLTILGHPTGRLLLGRPNYAIDMEKIIDMAALEKKVIELNSNPHRLDIDWRYCPYAKQKGVKICLGSDAHNLNGVHDVFWGVHTARKGWLEVSDIINCFSLKEMKKFLEM